MNNNTTTSKSNNQHLVAHFPGLKIYAGEPAVSAETRKTGALDSIVLSASHELRAVIQKGRSFQRSNPQVQVLMDRGRFLVIDVTPDVKLHEEPGCYAIVAQEDFPIGFELRRTPITTRRNETTEGIKQLSGPFMQTVVKDLANIFTRHSLSDGYKKAMDLCEESLREAGCHARRMKVSIPNGTTGNLVGYRGGTGENRRLFIVCAHLDSVNHQQGVGGRAPGADDNATGAATVLGIAKAMTKMGLRHDVEFILFGGEEQGLFGSKAYVSALSPSDKERIEGVINIDMAGSKNSLDLSVLLEGAEVSRTMMENLARVASTYTELTTQMSFKPFASDHVSFIEAGLPAVLTIEGTDDAYQHEHTDRDTVDKLNFDLHFEITTMNLAWLLEQTV